MAETARREEVERQRIASELAVVEQQRIDVEVAAAAARAVLPEYPYNFPPRRPKRRNPIIEAIFRLSRAETGAK